MPAYRNQFPTTDPGTRRIALVGEALGANEVMRGLPFQGAAGQLLDRQLAAAGLLRSHCFVGNVCDWQPPKNDFNTIAWDDGRLQASIAVLLSDLATFAPTLVVTLGNVPLHLFLVGNVVPPRRRSGGAFVHVWPRKVTDWRGSLFVASPLTGERVWSMTDYETMTDADSRTLSLSNGPHLSPLDGQPTEPGGLIVPLTPAPAAGLSEEPGAASGGNGNAHVAAAALWNHSNGAAGGNVVGVDVHAGQHFSSASSLTKLAAKAEELGANPRQLLPFRWKCLSTLHPAYCLRAWAECFNLQHGLKRARDEGGDAALVLPVMDFDWGPR